ncbi:hypothetical protein [Azospirillum doebereinerae]
MAEFQSTPPHGERPLKQAWELAKAPFQSTPPHGERHAATCSACGSTKFQSTPPHGERPPPINILNQSRRVSIHAPARGATVRRSRHGHRQCVSIHAPARGATSAPAATTCPRRMFQSTPPHGERLPRPHPAACGREFQSTPPHGERRPLNSASSGTGSGFNPRPRTGSDSMVILVPATIMRFQSTPPHGERPATFDRSNILDVSIHAPARGATPDQPTQPRCWPCFNPRPRTGSDLLPDDGLDDAAKFQSTPPHGERRH